MKPPVETEMPPSAITSDLAALLATVQRPGDFYVAGTADLFAPLLEVDSVGPIALPLLPSQAAQLIAAAERAPFGRGEQTLVDTTVRRTWQIAADRVRLGGKHWPRTLAAILERVAAGLGLAEPPAADLYKLLIYDTGSFFIGHRDTEKAPGMFGTLVVVLPSLSEGGALIVRHQDREARLDLRCPDPSEATFAAFYADCVHEVLPVVSGTRLALVYNLLRPGRGQLPQPPNYTAEQARLAALLQAWRGALATADDAVPTKLIYPLEHAYTSAELGFPGLKGADAAVAGVLAAAARQAGCDLHLALMSVAESGIAEHAGGYGRRDRWSAPEFVVAEVCEHSATLSEWRPLDGETPVPGELPVADGELSPPDAFDDLDPDEEHFHEATGNEGASFERTYRRAALVLWPRDQVFVVLAQAGLAAALPYLHDLTGRWAAAGAEHGAPLWQQAHALSDAMLADWPGSGWRRADDPAPGPAGQLLELLTRLGDAAHIERFLDEVATTGACGLGDGAAVIDALALLPKERAARLIERVITATADTRGHACADLLRRAAAAWPQDQVASLAGAAAALVARVPGAAAGPAGDPWQQPRSAAPEFVADLLTALDRIDTACGAQAVATMLATPAAYGMDDVLVPALRQLTRPPAAPGATVSALAAACLAHLRARVAEPLEPPSTWRRDNTLPCRCDLCMELSRFLADPAQPIWMLKAAAPMRSHVESTIRTSQCDVKTATERRGSPHSLICTKTEASYERRVRQRKRDLEDLAQLAGRSE